MARKSKKLNELCVLFEENNITAKTIEDNDEVIYELKKRAQTINDSRHSSYVRHLLEDIVLTTIFAIFANANEWSDIESFAKKKEKWLRKYLELPYGIPSDDTFRIVIGSIETSRFYSVVVSYLMELIDGVLKMSFKKEEDFERDVIAVDGKESSGSKRKETDRKAVKALRTLNVFSNSYRMCLGQIFIDEKTNEIPAAQEILKLIDLKGSIVTCDALNTQKKTARIVRGGKGDYVFALKGNHSLFYEEVVQFFSEDVLDEIKKEKGYYETREKEHSAFVVREYYITSDVGWYAEETEWKDLRSFGMVRKTTKKKNGETVVEDRHYICSIEGNDAELFEHAVRDHWGVENLLHWHLDFTFQDDKNTSMERTGAKNLQIMKKIVLSMLNIVKASYKMSLKRIRYEVSLDYENGIEKLFSLMSLESIKKALQSN